MRISINDGCLFKNGVCKSHKHLIVVIFGKRFDILFPWPMNEHTRRAKDIYENARR